MASRRARLADNTENYDSESDGDTEPGASRPIQRQGSKKRISEIDAHSDSGRVPLRAVNINDDAAEKRRRRKSTKLAVIENAEAGPSVERHDQAESSKAAQAKQKQQQLNSVAQPPIIDVPLDVMSSNFEEWMKMATDNVRASASILFILGHATYDHHCAPENQRCELVELCAD